MTNNALYIWLEGGDDERLFSKIMVPLFSKTYSHILIVKYANMNPGKVKNYLDSIKSMKNTEYLFVADADKHPCITSKKEWISSKYERVDFSRILIIRKMI